MLPVNGTNVTGVCKTSEKSLSEDAVTRWKVIVGTLLLVGVGVEVPNKNTMSVKAMAKLSALGE